MAVGCEELAVNSDFGSSFLNGRDSGCQSSRRTERCSVGSMMSRTRQEHLESTTSSWSASGGIAICAGLWSTAVIKIDAVGVIAGIARLSSRQKISSQSSSGATIARPKRLASSFRGNPRRHRRLDACDGGPRRTDRQTSARPDVQERFAMTRREAFRQGVDGAVLDLMLLHQPWGFDLEDIAVTTHWWHGSLDSIAPLRPFDGDDINRNPTHDLRGRRPRRQL